MCRGPIKTGIVYIRNEPHDKLKIKTNSQLLSFFLSSFSLFRNHCIVYITKERHWHFRQRNEFYKGEKNFALIFADMFTLHFTQYFLLVYFGTSWGFAWNENGLRFAFFSEKNDGNNEKTKQKQFKCTHVVRLIWWQFYVSSTFFCVMQC